jgi:hypothetical protein
MKRYAKRRKPRPHVYSGHCEVCGASKKASLILQRVGSKYNPFMCPFCARDYLWRKIIMPKYIESLREAK